MLDSQKPATGNWLLEAGDWKLATGNRRLETGISISNLITTYIYLI